METPQKQSFFSFYFKQCIELNTFLHSTSSSSLFQFIVTNDLQRALESTKLQFEIYMDKQRRKQPKTVHNSSSSSQSQEVSSIEWELIEMTDQEEDLIYRMYNLVGDRWELIAGRIPGRKPEEIERFWIMRHQHGVATHRTHLNIYRRCNKF